MPFELTLEQVLWFCWFGSVVGLMAAAAYCSFPTQRDFAEWRELNRSPFADQGAGDDL